MAETVQLIQAAASSKGVEVFAIIDHAAGARRAGMEMPETQVMILGSPAVGTPMMVAAPDLALDLPARVLVRATSTGSEVLLNDPQLLAARYGLNVEQVSGLGGISRLVEGALKV
ncbi:MAG: DUF302 domain-containing protein [Candidatus Dormibacteria bacterium]